MSPSNQVKNSYGLIKATQTVDSGFCNNLGHIQSLSNEYTESIAFFWVTIIND